MCVTGDVVYQEMLLQCNVNVVKIYIDSLRFMSKARNFVQISTYSIAWYHL